MKRILILVIIFGFSFRIDYAQKQNPPKMINEFVTIDSLMKTHKISFIKLGISFLPSLNFEINIDKQRSINLSHRVHILGILPSRTLQDFGLNLRNYFADYPRRGYVTGGISFEKYKYFRDTSTWDYSIALGLGHQAFMFNSKYPIDIQLGLSYYPKGDSKYSSLLSFNKTLRLNPMLAFGLPILIKRKPKQ